MGNNGPGTAFTSELFDDDSCYVFVAIAYVPKNRDSKPTFPADMVLTGRNTLAWWEWDRKMKLWEP